jgi:transposase
MLVERCINRECLFVVASTKLSMPAAEILKEYKTQSAVERKFQFMKSSQFVDSLYLDSPKRIEALGYLLLILYKDIKNEIKQQLENTRKNTS